MRATLDAIADALAYPRAASGAVLAESIAVVRKQGVNVAVSPVVAALSALADWLGDVPLGAAEERYTALFDLSPVCTLNIGYHLFGESYERGALLAGLTRELVAVGLVPTEEIPDHLPVVLRLLGRMPAADDRALLVSEVLLPGVGMIVRELEAGSDPWSDLLRALPALLVAIGESVGVSSTAPLPPRRLPMVEESSTMFEEALHA